MKIAATGKCAFIQSLPGKHGDRISRLSPPPTRGGRPAKRAQRASRSGGGPASKSSPHPQLLVIPARNFGLPALGEAITVIDIGHGCNRAHVHPKSRVPLARSEVDFGPTSMGAKL